MIDNKYNQVINEDEINLHELFLVIYRNKWLISSLTFLTSIVALVYSLLLPNIYESQAIVAPNESSNQSSLIQRYSGLANLAGVNLPSQEVESNSSKAIKKMVSLSFFESNILPKIFLPDLMAFDYWNAETNSITYNKKIFDSSKNIWVRKYSFPQKLVPSAQESFMTFIEDHLTISEDKKTGFITVKIKHQSPYIAKEWAKLLIDEINNFYRKNDKDEAERALSYLNMQIAKTNLSEIKGVIAALMQQETQKLTLVEANEFYVYEYIDPPAVMESKSEPLRLFIIFMGALIGIIAGIIFVLLRHYTSKK